MDFRLIGGTNRDAFVPRHDLVARLALRLALPDLAARCDDIPLLVRHLRRGASDRSLAALDRFVEKSGPPASPYVPYLPAAGELPAGREFWIKLPAMVTLPLMSMLSTGVPPASGSLPM